MIHKMVVPFKAYHYKWLQEDPAEGCLGVDMTSDILLEMEKCQAWTAVLDGSPIACAGFIPQWPGRCLTWAYLTQKTAGQMSWITAATKKHLQDVKGRIELTVRKDFELGHRWARVLGFEVETQCLKQYGPLGEDHVGYVRFNHAN